MVIRAKKVMISAPGDTSPQYSSMRAGCKVSTLHTAHRAINLLTVPTPIRVVKAQAGYGVP